MDIEMPKMDGLEATRLIRQHESGGAHRTPIVALSGNVRKEQIKDALAAGMDDYLTKPFQKQSILNIVEKYSPRASPSAVAAKNKDSVIERVSKFRAEAADFLQEHYLFSVQRDGLRWTIRLSASLSLSPYMQSLILKQLRGHIAHCVGDWLASPPTVHDGTLSLVAPNEQALVFLEAFLQASEVSGEDGFLSSYDALAALRSFSHLSSPSSFTASASSSSSSSSSASSSPSMLGKRKADLQDVG